MVLCGSREGECKTTASGNFTMFTGSVILKLLQCICICSELASLHIIRQQIVNLMAHVLTFTICYRATAVLMISLLLSVFEGKCVTPASSSLFFSFIDGGNDAV